MLLMNRSSPAQPTQILLLRPQSRALSRFPPLGLLSLAASLRRAGYAARVLDLAEPEDREALARWSPAAAPSLIGITATTPELTAAAALVAALRQRLPDAPVVLGGVHVTALGADALTESGADFGALGEGEETLVELVTHLAEARPRAALAAIRGLAWRDGQHVTENPPRPVIQDIDALPPPAWDLIDADRYLSRPWGILQERARAGFIVTSRGCPHACRFCASPSVMGRRFRGHAPARVVDEIEALYRTLGVREILIADDAFTTDPARAAAICEEILRRGLDLSWRTPNGVHLDTLDEPLLRLMRRSGCYLLGFGVEAADPALLQRSGKPIDLDRVSDGIAMVRRQGILCFGTFILGMPGQTRGAILETTRFAVSSALDIAHFGLYAPYPGSPDFDTLASSDPPPPGLRDWDRYLLSEAHPAASLPPAELKALLRRAYLSFYLRPARQRLYRKMLHPSSIREAGRALHAYLS
jgi:anaerobic magnesium-protoporphyrin IX monomethyl ester cyclase